MPFIYHLVPINMKGNIIYPLNILKFKLPDVYKEQIKKYTNRKSVQKIQIPILNCSWLDVLHFTLIHPSKIKKALREIGFNKLPKLKWFKIRASSLDKNLTIIYLYKNESIKNSDFVKYSPSKFSLYNKIYKKTKKYYLKEFKKGKKPLFFAFVPHILYKNSLHIKSAEIIEV